jgi:hypothetical protein
MKECRILVAMNEDGDWVVTDDESDALSKLSNDVGGYHARVVAITVHMSPPVMPEASVTVPDDAGETVSIEAADNSDLNDPAFPAADALEAASRRGKATE